MVVSRLLENCKEEDLKSLQGELRVWRRLINLENTLRSDKIARQPESEGE